MKPHHIVLSMLVAVSGLAAVFVAQPWSGQRSQPNPAPVVVVPQVPTKTIVVDDGLRPMSISISDVHGGTYVVPGDHVDIMLTRDSHTGILLQNIKVLAIDQRTDQPKSGRTATVEVNTVDAQKLTLSQTAGTLSLALRATGSVEAAAPRRITLKDLGPAFEIYSKAQDDEGKGEGRPTSQGFGARESSKKIRELIARTLMGEDVCSEKLGLIERKVVCTPEGIFKWVDPDFAFSAFSPHRCQRCARYQNPFAYKMCADGRIKGGPRTIFVDPVSC